MTVKAKNFLNYSRKLDIYAIWHISLFVYMYVIYATAKITYPKFQNEPQLPNTRTIKIGLRTVVCAGSGVIFTPIVQKYNNYEHLFRNAILKYYIFHTSFKESLIY